MFRRALLFSLLLLAATSLAAQDCELVITASCEPGPHGSRECESRTEVTGNGCSGLLYTSWFSPALPDIVSISAPETSYPFDQCFGSEAFGDIIDATLSFCHAVNGTLANGSRLLSRVNVSGVVLPSAVDARPPTTHCTPMFRANSLVV